MNHNILPILEFRTEALNLKRFESELGIRLPPIFRAFMENFKPILKDQYVYLPRTDREKKFIESDYRKITKIVYSSNKKDNLTEEDDELALIEFKGIDSMLEYCIPDEDDMKDMIFISDHGSSDSLLVGIGEENMDKIFLYSELGEEIITEIAKDIFSFLLKCQVVESHFDGQYYKDIRPITVSKLFKKWGEDFWRVE